VCVFGVVAEGGGGGEDCSLQYICMLLMISTCATAQSRWLWTIFGHRKGRLQWPKIRGTAVAGFSFHITMETWQRSECDWLQVDDGATTMQETVPTSCQSSAATSPCL